MHLHRTVLRAAVPAVFAWSMAFAAAQPASAASSTKVDLSTIQIDNFGQVNATYFRGAQPQGHDYADLAVLGVKAIVDLTSDDSDASEPAMAAAAGIKFFKLPMTTHQQPVKEDLARFLSIVNDPANQPVYVHCVGGRHRTGVMTAVYRMTQDGWTAEKAFQEMKQYKFGADFLHVEFKQFVYGYAPVPARATVPVSATRVSAGG